MKKFQLSLILAIFILLLTAVPVLAYVMSSTNYQIEIDSINFGGGLGNSVNYNLESTMGEIGTGYISSASYFGSIGYLQSSSSTIPSFCDNDGTCEPANGETTTNCPNDCTVPVCNYNNICEPANGETSVNCSDCQGGGGGGGGSIICNYNNICEPANGETSVNCSDCQVQSTTTPTTTETFLISNIIARSVTTSSAEIIWETNRNAICGLSWGLTTDYLSGSSAGLDFFFNHVRPITNLQASSTYHYKIFCQDENGSTTESFDNIFTTLSGPDEIAPGNIIGLRSIPGDRKISLFWTNPSDYDFAGVIIRRSTNFYPTLNSGIEVYNGTGNSVGNGEVFFDDLGLINGVLYYYSVFAYDTSGNFASGAATIGRPFEVEIVTTTPPTSTPPEIPSTSTPPGTLPTTTPPEIPSTSTIPEIPTTTTLLNIDQDLFFKDFDFSQNGLFFEVKQDQVDVNLGSQLNISLKQSKIIPGTERMILYFSTKDGIETYLFVYNPSLQNYSVSLPLPNEIDKYNVKIILLDSNNNKIKEITGWIKLKSQEPIFDKISNKISQTVIQSVEVFYDTIKPINSFAKSDTGKTLAGVTVGVSTINLFFAVPWWNWYFLQFLFTQPFILFFSKRRKGWGTVYNSITKKPVDLALVRLYDAKTDQLIKSRVTDANGRYIFLVDEGDYYLQVQKPGFDFPSKLLNNAKEDDSYVDLYYGEKFSVKTGEKGVITANIPIDQQEVNLTDKEILKKHFKFRSLWRLSYLGPIFATVYFIVFPSIFSGLLAVLHFILLLLFYRLSEWKKPKSWGRVYEQGTKKPLPKTITRIFSPEYNRMLEFYVTDNRGRYGFLTGSNKYYITADKEGYNSIKTDIIDLSKNKSSDFIINQDLALSKLENANLSNNSKENEDILEKETFNKEQEIETSTSNLEENNLVIKDKEQIKEQVNNEDNIVPPSENIFG